MLCLVACGGGGGNEPSLPTPAPKPDPTPEPAPVITISSSSDTSPTISETGGTATVDFTTDAAWTASVAETRTASWVSVSPTGGGAGSHTLTITTTENTTPDERNATITLKAGATTTTIKVSQKQCDALTVTSNKLEIAAEGGAATIEVQANVDYQYEISTDAQAWITATTTRGMEDSQINLQVAANESTAKREGSIVISSGELSETVTVYQAGSEPTLVLTQNEYAMSSEGGTIKVELNSNIGYSVQLPAGGWIAEAETRALSAHTHYFEVAANDTYDGRTGTIVFTGKEGGITENVTVSQVQKDAIVVAKSEYTLSAEGGALDFSVNANVDFTVSLSADWITQVDTRGLTEKPLHFDVSANPVEEAREATITLTAGELTQVITVKQEAKAKEEAPEETPEETPDETPEEKPEEKPDDTPTEEPVLSVAQTEYSFTADGGNLDFAVTTNVDFSVSISADWITQVDTRAATEKSLYFNVSANPVEEVREATITLMAGELTQVITVKQEAKEVEFVPYITIAQKEYEFTSAEQNFDVTIDSNVDFGIYDDTLADWIRVWGQEGNVYKLGVTENTSISPRTTSIKIENLEYNISQTIKITQAALVPYLNISQTEFDLTNERQEINVTIESNVTFEVESDKDWVVYNGGLEGTCSFIIEKNTTSEKRTATITIKNTEHNVFQTIEVTQAAFSAYLNVGQTEFDLTNERQEINVTIESNVTFEVESDKYWVVYNGGLEGTCSFIIEKNTTSEKRTATITIKNTEHNVSQTIEVTQAAFSAYLNVNQTAFDLTNERQEINVTIESNVTFEVEFDKDWITYEGRFEDIHYFNIQKNETSEKRTATITIKNTEHNAFQTIEVTQAAFSAYLNVGQTEFDLTNERQEINVTIESNVTFEVESDKDWVVYNGDLEGACSFIIGKNTTSERRTAVVTIKNTKYGISKNIQIEQAGKKSYSWDLDDIPTKDW